MSNPLRTAGANAQRAVRLFGRVSIRRRLLVWLLIPLTLAVLVADVVTYLKARQELLRFLDAELEATARAAADARAPLAFGARVIRIEEATAEAGSQAAGSARSHAANDARSQATGDPRSQATDDPRSQAADDARPQAAGDARSQAGDDAGPPFMGQAGATTVEWQEREWRVVSIEHEGRLIQVAAPLDAWRDRIEDAAAEIIKPFTVAIVPLLALLIWLGIGRGLEPLTVLAASLRKRAPDDLQPLDETGLPRELVPLVQSLNGLLLQLADVLANERRFIADAAHGLRTPLTALQLQVENLARANTAEDRVAALAQLRAGVPRAAHLVEQLLTMARLAPRAPATRAALDLEQIVKDALVAQQPLAERRRIDLGLARSESIVFAADAGSLRIMLDNLIDNALRYTPEGGVVDVHVCRDGNDAVVEVTDTGPGISPAERGLVFQRFYRGECVTAPGSGLGLAIVAEVVKQHGGRIDLDTGVDGHGLKVTVRLPTRGLRG